MRVIVSRGDQGQMKSKRKEKHECIRRGRGEGGERGGDSCVLVTRSNDGAHERAAQPNERIIERTYNRKRAPTASTVTAALASAPASAASKEGCTTASRPLGCSFSLRAAASPSAGSASAAAAAVVRICRASGASARGMEVPKRLPPWSYFPLLLALPQ